MRPSYKYLNMLVPPLIIVFLMYMSMNAPPNGSWVIVLLIVYPLIFLFKDCCQAF